MGGGRGYTLLSSGAVLTPGVSSRKQLLSDEPVGVLAEQVGGSGVEQVGDRL